MSRARPTTSGGNAPMRIDQQALAETWLLSARSRTGVQSAGMICSPSASATGSSMAAPNSAGEEQQGQRLQARRAPARRRSDSRRRAGRRPARAGRRGNGARDNSALPPISSARAERREEQRDGLDAATASGAPATGPRRRRRSCAILPNRVALPSLVRWMPACQAARSAAKKKAATTIDQMPARAAASGPAGRPARASSEQERQGQRQPPEAGRDRPDVGQAHQPRPERQRDIAEQQCRRRPKRCGGRIVHPDAGP